MSTAKMVYFRFWHPIADDSNLKISVEIMMLIFSGLAKQATEELRLASEVTSGVSFIMLLLSTYL